MLTTQINNQVFTFHPSGGLFWEAQSMLLIADVHLGKIMHFRKHGAAIPADAAHENIEKLTEAVNQFQPKTVCFLGDLFHSDLNTEWDDFVSWVTYIPSQAILITGNHDIIPSYRFEDIGITVMDEMILDSFYFTHYPTHHDQLFNFCGHIHPGVKMQGTGRQVVRLACFYKTKSQMILPAFGNFTGKHILTPTPSDEIFVIADGEVVPVN